MMREKIKQLSEVQRLVIAAVLVAACVAANICMKM